MAPAYIHGAINLALLSTYATTFSHLAAVGGSLLSCPDGGKDSPNSLLVLSSSLSSLVSIYSFVCYVVHWKATGLRLLYILVPVP